MRGDGGILWVWERGTNGGSGILSIDTATRPRRSPRWPDRLQDGFFPETEAAWGGLVRRALGILIQPSPQSLTARPGGSAQPKLAVPRSSGPWVTELGPNRQPELL